MRVRTPLFFILLVVCDCSYIQGAENVVSREAEHSASGLPTAPQRSDVWIAGAWTDSAMTRMAEKLQPTGMTGFTGREQPDRTAADEQEKKQAYGEHRKALAGKLGMHKLHFAVRTYHHQPNFPDSARRIGIAGEPLRNVIALGEPGDYATGQFEALRHRAAGGGSVVVVGDPEGWREYLPADAITVIREDLGVRYQVEDRPAKLTEEIRHFLRATAIETNAGPNVLIKLERLAETPDWRLHVVNRNYRWLHDEVEELSHVTITLDASALGLGQVEDVRAGRPPGNPASGRLLKGQPGLENGTKSADEEEL